MEDIIKAFGYDPEKIKTVEDLTNAVNTDFVRRDNVHNDADITGRIVGKQLGQIEKAFMSEIKEFGVDLTDEDLKDAKYTFDKIKVGLNKIKNHHISTTGELKELANKKGADAAKEWQEKYSKADERANQYEGKVKELSKMVEEKENWARNEVKSFRINDAKSKAFGRAVFKDGLTDLEKTGFETIFNSKYEIDLDDKDQPFIYEKETKKRIDNKGVVGTFMTIDDVLKMEIEANKLNKVNTQSAAKPVNPFAVQSGENGNTSKGKGIPVNPKFFGK